MKLILAQGNPGPRYAHTRHNVGFSVLDAFAEANDARWHSESKFRADIAEATINGEKVLLVKPLSFYNETGQVARGLVDFYKLDPVSDVLVIHDELALPFGTVRVREKGSDAGNNGIKSLNAHLGQDYWRIRIGVWHESRNQINDVDFVLGKFSTEERASLETITQQTIVPLITRFVKGELEAVSHSV
ncbi:MAG TPA: aminoacyl-tRNA hydrolase [Dongiaceae bacterium]|nr:aminoacyl-tRNA hydrolase [Dongiaceae bacterium]